MWEKTEKEKGRMKSNKREGKKKGKKGKLVSL